MRRHRRRAVLAVSAALALLAVGHVILLDALVLLGIDGGTPGRRCQRPSYRTCPFVWSLRFHHPNAGVGRDVLQRAEARRQKCRQSGGTAEQC